ncbi:MAG: hypothetical protein K9M51_00230 [Candidatus Gracilibacteria bacterium]|nr:hypothetical protein [Candidatus Gracilibacteria bacterium]
MADSSQKQDPKKDDTSRSFLSETQQEGRAAGDIPLDDLDKAIAGVTDILDPAAVELYRSQKEEDWPTCKMALYCHDCGGIVPAGVGQTLRGNPRTVCGTCGSKKISSGREEALRKFYHLDTDKKKKS